MLGRVGRFCIELQRTAVDEVMLNYFFQPFLLCINTDMVVFLSVNYLTSLKKYFGDFFCFFITLCNKIKGYVAKNRY